MRTSSGLVLAGVAPARDRSAVVAEVAPGPEIARARVGAHLDELSATLLAELGVALPESTAGAFAVEVGDVPVSPAALERWRDRCIARIGRLLDDGVGEESEIAEVLLGLVDVRVRDTVLWDLLSADSAAGLARAAETLVRCVRAAPPGAVAPAATLLAMCAWQRGDGVRAGAALERVMADDPDYSLARLLLHALDAGLPPQEWRAAMAGLARDDVRGGSEPEPPAPPTGPRTGRLGARRRRRRSG
jgi:hypothetical protein